MFSATLPLRMIVTQLLLLLVAIAIEAWVLNYRLKLGRRTSVQYSICLNLISTAIGWLLFFQIFGWLPEGLKQQFISYLFFDRFFTSSWSGGINTIIILTALLTFFGTFVVELTSLNLLETLLLNNQNQNTSKPEDSRSRDRENRDRANRIAAYRAITLLFTNACSYTAIVAMMLLRSVILNQPTS